MKLSTMILLFLLGFSACQSQADKETSAEIAVGGPCEGCEAAMDYGDRQLSPTDTLPGYFENQPRLKITGTVYKNDGVSPAENIILYIYHTNREGIYENNNNSEGWERRHGVFRGWIKTGADGKFTFYTFRPASYPGRTEPEHIHVTVKEPGKTPYFIDDILFDDDPLLTPERRKRLSNRTGPGIVKLQKEEKYLAANRNIILGLNIRDYQ